ncbi:MAG: MBL fold metallo-hydrolase, partial [Chloroflexota bacterium]|nr:MBL fold metallo-hydrolase [Chloroflexota bacterium]
YVVHYDENHYLIDCGSGTESSHSDLLNGLEQAGLQPSDLTHILLTHAHIDHYGGLSKLKPLTDAKIGCHELDVQTVAHHEASLALTSRRLASFLAETGLAKEETETLLNIYRFTKAIYQSVPVEFTYDVMDMRGPFEIIHLPGHCPGHVAIRFDDIVFCGDMVVEGVTPHLSAESIGPYNGLDHYLESLDRFQHWSKDARLILNGHDDVITDVTAKVEATHQNLVRRMSKAIKALSEPLTIAEVCVAVYGGTGGYQQLLVIEKTGAYIEYFYEHGLIEITNADEVEQGMPARYQRLREIADDEILRKVNCSVVQ